MGGKRSWKVQQGKLIWKRPRKLREALDLARHLLHGSDTPVTVIPFIVPVKYRRNAVPAGAPTREDGAGNPTTGCDAPRVVTAHPLGDERKARPSGEFHTAAGEGVKDSPMYDPAGAAPSSHDIPHSGGR